jgi:uncharacterized small protein (DUF1192 family)
MIQCEHGEYEAGMCVKCQTTTDPIKAIEGLVDRWRERYEHRKPVFNDTSLLACLAELTALIPDLKAEIERLEAYTNALEGEHALAKSVIAELEAQLEAVRGLQRYKAECSDKHALTHRNDPDAVIKAAELDAILNPKGGEG